MSLSTIPSKCVQCCHKWQNFVLFHSWVVFHDKCILQLCYPFIYHWTLRLPLYFGKCRECCYEHWVCMYLFELVFCFSNIYPGMELLDQVVVLVLVETLPCCFPQWMHEFTFPPTLYEGSFVSTSTSASVTCVLSGDSHSARCVGIPHCGFDLHIPGD